MKYRSLGSSGLKVSAIGLGTNQFGGKVDLSTVKEIIHAAIDNGINFIDTADVYQEGRSEEYIGKAISDRRDRVVIATKVFFPMSEGPNDQGASRQHILEGVQASLHRLNIEYIDLYQIHRWDPQTPIEETMQALKDLVRWGKVRYIGASNYTAWQLVNANCLAEKKGWTQFISIQPHYHMLERSIEKEIIPACRFGGTGILPYFPLAGGFLTGKYKPGKSPPVGSRGESSEYVRGYMTPGNYAKLEALSRFSQEHSHSLNELAHAWLLAQRQVASVISGATRVEHVLANAAAGDWELTDKEVKEVNAILDAE